MGWLDRPKAINYELRAEDCMLDGASYSTLVHRASSNEKDAILSRAVLCGMRGARWVEYLVDSCSCLRHAMRNTGQIPRAGTAPLVEPPLTTSHAFSGNVPLCRVD